MELENQLREVEVRRDRRRSDRRPAVRVNAQLCIRPSFADCSHTAFVVFATELDLDDQIVRDLFRHPRYRINIVFCDSHVETLTINERDLQRAVLLPQ